MRPSIEYKDVVSLNGEDEKRIKRLEIALSGYANRNLILAMEN